MATDEFIVTLDGPAGSGKSTVAHEVAKRLGWRFLDTGAMYRAATLAALEARVSFAPLDAAACVAAIERRPVTLDERGLVRLGGVSVGDRIRAQDVTDHVSVVSAIPAIRDVITAEQRAFGARAAPGLVAEGRDMATVVFPNAAHRLFLDASAEVRAERRRKQLLAKGLPAPTLDELIAKIRERDRKDSEREVAPLAVGAGVQVIDTSDMSFRRVVRSVLWHVRGRGTIPYRIARWIFLQLLRIFCGYRTKNAERIPKAGGVLMVSNHASFIDPLVAGCGTRRNVTFLLRGTLTETRFFRFASKYCDFVEVKRDGTDRDALRAAVRAIGQGKLVLLFPEGTRTRDGSLGSLKAGFALIARETGAPVVPAWCDGTFAVWPRHRKLPRPFRRVEARYGPAFTIGADEPRDVAVAKLEAAWRELAGAAGLRAGREATIA